MTATTYTKGNLVEMALSDLGIANYVFDVEAEESIAALRKADALAAEWQAKLHADFGYDQPSASGTSLPSDLPGIDDAIVAAFTANLALRLASSYGKTASGELRAAARDGRGLVFSLYAKPAVVELSSRLPMGAGHRHRRTYFPRATAEQ